MWTRIIGMLRKMLHRLTGAEAEDAFERDYQADVREAIANNLPIPPRPRSLPF